jgi:hypothetical protein
VDFRVNNFDMAFPMEREANIIDSKIIALEQPKQKIVARAEEQSNQDDLFIGKPNRKTKLTQLSTEKSFYV